MRLAAGIVILFVTANSLVALDPALAVSQYLRTSWTQEVGADLPAVHAIAQSPGGFLWLGSGAGLFQWEGIRFVHWTPHAGEGLPSNDIRFLIPSSRRG